jgi:hypothetical protein
MGPSHFVWFGFGFGLGFTFGFAFICNYDFELLMHIILFGWYVNNFHPMVKSSLIFFISTSIIYLSLPSNYDIY